MLVSCNSFDQNCCTGGICSALPLATQPEFSLLLGTGERVVCDFDRRYIVCDDIVIDISIPKQIESQAQNEAVFATARSEMTSVKTQLDNLRKKMGLNISEIAAMLLVSRPTIYEWIDLENKLRKSNQTRLDNIYDLCLYWEKKNLGHLGIYLYRKIGNQQDSLFSMLSKKALNKEQICFVLDQVGEVIADAQKKRAAHDELLKKHGFEEISKEELHDRFERLVFTIGSYE